MELDGRKGSSLAEMKEKRAELNGKELKFKKLNLFIFKSMRSNILLFLILSVLIFK